MKTLRTVAIGGSNTLMKNGYLHCLPDAAQKFGVKVELLANLAIGNTTSVMGLINLKANSAIIENADLLIIEYALNDTSAYGDSREAFERWLRTYEALVRTARTINSKIDIILVILGEKTGSHLNSISTIHAGIYYLSEWYGLQKADVNSEFVKVFGKEVFETPNFYMNKAHYQRPVVTRLVAEIVAKQIPKLLDGPGQQLLPPLIDDRSPVGAELIQLTEIADIPHKTFSNSSFNETAVDLSNTDVVMEIMNGQPIGIRYVCEHNAAPLYMAVGNEVYDILTLRPAMVIPKFPFLVACLNLDTLPKFKGLNTFKFSVCPPRAESTNIYQFGARRVAVSSTNLSLQSILYTGELTGLSAVRSCVPEEIL